MPLRARSIVGLLPLAAVDDARAARRWRACRTSRSGSQWFTTNRPEGRAVVQHMASPAHAGWRMLSIVDADRLRRAPRSDARRDGVPLAARPALALAAATTPSPLHVDVDGVSATLDYEPGESTTRPLRRQLELARPGLVPDQLPARRGAARVPPLLRRRTSRSSARPAPGSALDLGAGRRRAVGAPRRASSSRRGRQRARSSAATSSSRATPPGTTCSRSTSTSTATPAPGSAPRTRPAGPGSSPTSSCAANGFRVAAWTHGACSGSCSQAARGSGSCR